MTAENGRVQCHSENKDNYSITLTNVTEADKHVYYCRFITDRPDGKWTEVPGVQLNVTDLQVETQQRVKEGDSVTLTCKTTCRLTEETTFIWYRNTQTLTEHTVNEFHLQSVSRHDSGVFRCAIRGSEHLSSPGVHLNVEYPPEKISVSINSSGVIVEGDSVNLTCSSESYPPVHIYSWFKENQTSSVGSGQTFSITNINSSLSGWFYCVAQNKHGSQRSAAVSLTVKGVHSVSGFVSGCGGLSIVFFMGLFIKNRRTDNREQDMNQHQVSEHTSSSSPAVDSSSSHESCADVTLTAVSKLVMAACFTISLMFLLMTAAVDGQQDWGVNYNPSYVCALRGSTVRMSCYIKYPSDHVVNKTVWTKAVVTTEEPDDMCLYGRVQCHSENKDSYNITLTNVTEADKHVYYCRFITDRPDGKWTEVPGVQLNVTDLQVETQQRVKEGDSVTFTCKTTCRLTEETTSIWYRNTQTLTEHTVNEFHLQSVSRNDSGVYRCAIRGSEHLSSPGVHLNVEYPPKISVSISPSGVIVEGDSVNLTCSSESNPPVHTYSWFKGKNMVKSGNIYSITSVRPDHSGEYKCKAINTHGEKYSEAVMMNVMYAPRNVSVSISSSGVIVEGDSVNLTCSSESNPPVHIYNWFKENQTSSVGSGQTFSITNINSSLSGWFYCVAQNKHGSQRSAAVSLTVKDPPEKTSVSISSSGVIVEGDSVNLTCSSESNPPVHNYSWFKENQTSSVGSGQTFSITNINSSLSGWFYCVAQNKHGSQRSAAVSLTVKGVRGSSLYIIFAILAECVGLFIIIIILIIKKRRTDSRAEYINQTEMNHHSSSSPPDTAVSSDDTYTALNPASRTSADIYNTIRSDQCRAADGVYTTFELQSRSSEYDTIAVNTH
ncbi:sialoadhesin-like [Triplophysa dalaica]|uniref:sialoadhesin-like n=1 Tax=Triplophysa dalaica TaxID=1582913 RepID=UPI0024DFFEFB|nr:sialoadhesin-like [Triplophysa dalaica]